MEIILKQSQKRLIKSRTKPSTFSHSGPMLCVRLSDRCCSGLVFDFYEFFLSGKVLLALGAVLSLLMC